VVRSGDADVCDGSLRGKAGEVSVGASSLHLQYVREGPLWPVAIHQKHVCVWSSTQSDSHYQLTRRAKQPRHTGVVGRFQKSDDSKLKPHFPQITPPRSLDRVQASTGVSAGLSAPPGGR